MAVPVAVPVKLTVQLPAVRMQLGALRPPVPIDVKVTVPVGTIAVPPAEVSATTTLHKEAWLITTGLAQVIVVELVRRPTMIVAAALVLARWVASLT